MTIGDRIKNAREELGYKQSQLADLVGVSPSAIANYENDISFPKEPILLRLFDALQVDANYLFQDSMNVEENTKKSPDGEPTNERYTSEKDLTTLVKEKIKQNYKSTREFAFVSEIPYTTIASALKKGLGGTAVETVIKICDILDIDIAEYTQAKKEPDTAGDDEQARLKMILIKLIDEMDLHQLHKFNKVIKYVNLSDGEFERLYEIARIAIPDLQDK